MTAPIQTKAEKATTALLEIEDLRTEIQLRRSVVHAVDGVSLTVRQGECLGIVGESGCGKTMTALSIMRLLPGGGRMDGGRITLDGTHVTALTEQAMRRVRGNVVGMVFQDPMSSLNPTMTIGDQIAESVLLHRDVGNKAALNRAVEVLGLVGMPKPAERVGYFPHQLSGGLRQRVMIAMALACEPKLLIADEPTTALDATISKQILELIDDLRARLGMAVILVTHDLGVIADQADEGTAMYAGRVVLETHRYGHAVRQPPAPLYRGVVRGAAGKGQWARTGGQGPDRRSESSTTSPANHRTSTRPPAACTFAPRCRYAQDTCRSEEPALTDRDDGHFYRCYFPVDTSPPTAGNGQWPGAGAKAKRTTPRVAAAATTAASGRRCCNSTGW